MMSGSPSPNSKQRTCDYCGDFTALLYCSADSAKLCFFCDRKVHSPNQLFSKHTRAQLCDSCGDSPASMLCSAENSVLCHNCDCEKHKHLASEVHQRKPLEGFSGCPSVTELLTILGVSEKSLLSNEGTSQIDYDLSDLHVWSAPSVNGLEYLITSTASSHKNRKSAFGRHKEEILSQLRELIKLEPDLIHGEVDAERQGQFGNLPTGFERDVEASMFPSYEAGVFCWHGESSDPTNQIVPSDTSSLRDFGEVVSAEDGSFTIPGTGTQANFNNEGKPSNSFNSENLSPTPKATPYELTSHERDSALLRYREKKKTRRYDKHIRYESRKVRAESRMRIKGRFVKDETQK
ncbi:zinc finger protein CONSTANS-LIKE 13-like [Glycine soja]|uniref:Zinc finger protein CONSTANS-LIKE 13 n=1 Tax=Glycine soja TaxID=3848 RepID=A0A445IGT2_GLYSO|nr:zinc finger protein CONSTANS-LIKE 13-like [Glycine soja]KHN03748.1 Zinc finger protein CONSTANS-LIKE 13 [Glycine soja]RZB85305.1 Zinc finger protein CONSTANS-LIKE 13 [Glycine soja]